MRAHFYGRYLIGVLVLAAWAMLIMPRAVAERIFVQDASHPSSADGTLLGSVVDKTGKEVSGALVKLQMQDGKKFFEVTTDASGSFAFRGLLIGGYVVSAEKSEVRSQGLVVVLVRDVSQSVRLVLGSEGPSGSTTSRQEMEFLDKPTFTVAGVTDWTAVGGHGSDATLRTSESLVRETVAMKASPTVEADRDVGGAREVRLREALGKAPGSYEATHELGGYYLHAERYFEAVPLLQSALKMSGGKAEDEYELARACAGSGDVGQAQLHVQRALVQKDSSDFHELAGQLDERAGDPLGAVREFEQAAQMAASEGNYFAWGSELLLHRAVWEASEVFRSGVKMYPASARMKAGWGAALFAGALYEQAAQQLCEASELNPIDTETYVVMGRVEMAAPVPLACVDEKLVKFWTLQPKSADAAFLYAMSLSKRDRVGSRKRVEGLLEQAVVLDPRYGAAYLQLGILAFAQRKYPEAIGFYKQAIVADPASGEAHYRLGVAYDRVGDAERAKEELQLHDRMEKAQADGLEEERRKIKQFLVVPHGVEATSGKL